MTPPFAARSLAILITLLALGCGSAPEAPADAPAEPAAAAPASSDSAARLAVDEAVITDGTLRFSGSTNLIDGAVLAYVLEHDGFASGDFDGYLEGVVTVSNGSFSHELDVARWPQGHARLRVSFSMAPGHGTEQPPAVVEAYGAQAERLGGPDVTETAGSRKLEIRFDVPLP